MQKYMMRFYIHCTNKYTVHKSRNLKKMYLSEADAFVKSIGIMYSIDLDHGLFLKDETNMKMNETTTSPSCFQEIFRRFLRYENTSPFSQAATLDTFNTTHTVSYFSADCIREGTYRSICDFRTEEFMC